MLRIVGDKFNSSFKYKNMRLKITFTFLVVFGIAFSSLGQITKKQIEEQINVMETSHQSCKDSGVDF